MAQAEIKKKPVNFENLLLGAALNIVEVTSLGQPLEVTKTTMSANRSFGITQAIRHVWSRGGILGFYQGLLPWAWIEASTKGAVLVFVASEAEYHFKRLGLGNFTAGIAAGMAGGVAQAYATMGFCTTMKTVEITRSKQMATGAPVESTFSVFRNLLKKEGVKGVNKGVNAVAIRQCTNWGSRYGLARLAENGIRSLTGKQEGQKLSVSERILASFIGGSLSAWNQPIEVVRVEMQSKVDDPKRPKNLTVAKTLKYIYTNNGIKGLYRGVTPRIGLSVWQTIFMVAIGDSIKEKLAERQIVKTKLA